MMIPIYKPSAISGPIPTHTADSTAKGTPKPDEAKKRQPTCLKEPKTNYPHKVQQMSAPYPKPSPGKSSQ